MNKSTTVSGTGVDADLEKQPSLSSYNNHSSTRNTRVNEEHQYFRAFDCLFGDDASLYYQWPGIDAYFRYLEESCFGLLLTNEYATLWPAIGLSRPYSPAECWP